ncbi:hypothetical protein BEP19_05820 [Ammoniphilus oxalaticus]|uniref:Uncharacterized protein n=1 Tax=Ammoniphilus oxalaticus TaxID=66863 RepID=A0A419SJ10_9BACL|nr:hypothetical protein [Ammoniphilus oxalaticus]RKD23940.1 hypothetical protein BEP19_05820 [Ammoniphilus oxalaticus]
MNRTRMSWMVGLGAISLAMFGWVSKRNRSPMSKMTHWTNRSFGWIRRGRITRMLSRMVR